MSKILNWFNYPNQIMIPHKNILLLVSGYLRFRTKAIIIKKIGRHKEKGLSIISKKVKLSKGDTKEETILIGMINIKGRLIRFDSLETSIIY